MLIQNNTIDDGDKIVIRLITGEEVIGTLTSKTEDEMVVTKPFKLQMFADGPALIPFSIIGTQNGQYYFQRKDVLSYYKLESSFEPDYIKVSTGIELIR